MNISQTGNIPTNIETFSIDMRCSGLRPAEVEVTINIEVTLNRATNNVTELVFRRKKICLERCDFQAVLFNSCVMLILFQ